MPRSLVVLAVLTVGAFAEPIKDVAYEFASPLEVVDNVFVKKQMDLLGLYYHIHEPVFKPALKNISSTWSLEKNIGLYTNQTAVKIFINNMENKRILPRGFPFSVLNSLHLREAKTLFNVIFSSINYDTFFKTAVYLRDRINENVFVYVLGIATLNYPETQGIILPPLYEVFPSYFYNGQIMNIAQRINIHGNRLIEFYPNTFQWEDHVVIRWNETVWPYHFKDSSVSYFTNDYHLNALYYNNHLHCPIWLSGTGMSSKFNRGAHYWFFHKQIVAHYYMERLSNGLGEIPELDFDTIEQGYESGLVYFNGIPFPTRPDYFNLNQPKFTDYLKKIKDVESRIRGAIDSGFIMDKNGERVSIRSPNATDLLGMLVEGNIDSPNDQYYQGIVELWKILLGNSPSSFVSYVGGEIPLIVPSILEQYQTTLRDPAFYMIWKRVLKFFDTWSSYLPLYSSEELAMPSVNIEQVEVDTLVTYFENVYRTITNDLFLTEIENESGFNETSVIVQQSVLNYNSFNIKLHVNSEAATTVDVRFFLAPKYDSNGVEIPLHENTRNFFLMDRFVYDLPAGKSVILRESDNNMNVIDKWTPATKVFEQAVNAYNGNGEFVLNGSELFFGHPRHLLIPKGRVGGMPFKFMAYIAKYMSANETYGESSSSTNGTGNGSGRISSYSLDFPMDRPLYQHQVEKLGNMYFKDVSIYHNSTPEMYNPFP